jgi:RND family efflux transporter MFP subunit
MAHLVAGLVILLSGCKQPENVFVPPPPPEVTVAKPSVAAVPEFLEQPGETEPAEEAEVRARVRGFIQAIEFEPGQRVEQGQLLYRIEPDNYQAELDAAKAAVNAADAAILVAQAALKNAEAEFVRTTAELDREQRLLDGNAGSQSDYDRARANNEAAKAAIEAATANIEVANAEKSAAEAAVQQAQLNLDYTHVTAPIDGFITKTEIKTGNLVDNGTQLAKVVNQDRIFANFSLSDRQVLQLQRDRADDPSSGDPHDSNKWKGITVLLRRELDKGFPFTGKLDYVDQTGVDAATGTLGLRAVFENPNNELFGGLFVTVRVPSEQRQDQLLVPQAALGRDQQGSFVLTVDSDNKVRQTRVNVRSAVSGWAAIEGPLDATTSVIIDGLQRAIPGMEVKPTEETLQVDEASLLRGAMLPDSDRRTSLVAIAGGADSN